ncbi:uncharacterized protein CIMG_12850 [Coccidioides immitis RS]|uniref:Uncharacterized protein n=1 Tax=Coccidioides immitis (strain RS) TaxID=246410 RepID=A0A0D8JSL8_COCIM|nr:uncharacterized protein CIMG_12850 [Coccidioides immitis RS]KJF60282.1 hypothetical protein CIMG_12850 [Coccidioides immitis RS]
MSAAQSSLIKPQETEEAALVRKKKILNQSSEPATAAKDEGSHATRARTNPDSRSLDSRLRPMSYLQPCNMVIHYWDSNFDRWRPSRYIPDMTMAWLVGLDAQKLVA